jgi:DNA-binding MarR family transcriptional regulator
MKEKTDLIDSEKHKLWILMTEVRRMIVQARNKLIDRQLIPPAQGAALYYIHIHPRGVTIKILSGLLSLSHNSVSELVSRMENKGWIKRVKDGKDARRAKITLTQQGEEACRHASQPAYICEIVSVLTPAQLKQFKAALELLKEKAMKSSDSLL